MAPCLLADRLVRWPRPRSSAARGADGLLGDGRPTRRRPRRPGGQPVRRPRPATPTRTRRPRRRPTQAKADGDADGEAVFSRLAGDAAGHLADAGGVPGRPGRRRSSPGSSPRPTRPGRSRPSSSTASPTATAPAASRRAACPPTSTAPGSTRSPTPPGPVTRAAAVVEPDALASPLECGDRDQRVRLIADAVEQLRDGRRDDVRRRRPLELDRARPTSPPLLEDAGVDDVRGFATNVSNFQTDEDEQAYGEELSALLGGAHYIIDSGRNGFGVDRRLVQPARPGLRHRAGRGRRRRRAPRRLRLGQAAGRERRRVQRRPAGRRVLARAGAGAGRSVRVVRHGVAGGSQACRSLRGPAPLLGIRRMEPGNEWVAVIIEDDPDVRDLIDIVLTQSGFRTVVTENGPDGVEAVRKHNPLITTLDVNMPGMDGFAVAKRLREFSSTYLIMITALADEIDVVQGFEAGADDYLVKPFRPRELRARADSMLRRPRARMDKPAGWVEGEPSPRPSRAARSRGRPPPRATWPPARRCRRCSAAARAAAAGPQPGAGAAARSRRAAAGRRSRRPPAPQPPQPQPRRPQPAAGQPRAGAPPTQARLDAVQRARAQQRDPGGHGQRRVGRPDPHRVRPARLAAEHRPPGAQQGRPGADHARPAVRHVVLRQRGRQALGRGAHRQPAPQDRRRRRPRRASSRPSAASATGSPRPSEPGRRASELSWR